MVEEWFNLCALEDKVDFIVTASFWTWVFCIIIMFQNIFRR